MGNQNLSSILTMKYTILCLIALFALSRQFDSRRLANTKDYQVGSFNKADWKCSNTKLDSHYSCLSTCDRASGCRANNDFARAGDKFETKKENGKICVRRVDHKGGWGMNLKVRCGLRKVVTIGNKRGNGRRCAKLEAGFDCPKECTKENGCRVNKDFKNARDAFKLEVKDGRVCATRTDGNPKGKGWGMRLAVRCRANLK